MSESTKEDFDEEDFADEMEMVDIPIIDREKVEIGSLSLSKGLAESLSKLGREADPETEAVIKLAGREFYFWPIWNNETADGKHFDLGFRAVPVEG